MNKQHYKLAILLIVCAFPLLSVSGEDIPPLTQKERDFVESLWRKKEPVPTKKEQDAQLKKLAQGKWTVQESCAGCHSIEKLLQGSSGWTEESWRGIIKRMVLQGAPGSEEDTELMALYLALFLGADSTDEIRVETLK